MRIVTKISEGWDLDECGWDLAEWLERLTANAVVATVLGSIPASFDTVESEGWHMKQCWISCIKRKNPNIPLKKISEGRTSTYILHLSVCHHAQAVQREVCDMDWAVRVGSQLRLPGDPLLLLRGRNRQVHAVHTAPLPAMGRQTYTRQENNFTLIFSHDCKVHKKK